MLLFVLTLMFAVSSLMYKVTMWEPFLYVAIVVSGIVCMGCEGMI